MSDFTLDDLAARSSKSQRAAPSAGDNPTRKAASTPGTAAHRQEIRRGGGRDRHRRAWRATKRA